MRQITFAGLLLAFTVGAATTVSAQQRTETRRPEARGELRGQRAPGGMLLRGINLTDAQKDQIKKIFESQRPKAGDPLRVRVRAARESGDTAQLRELRVQMHQRMEQHRNELNGQIRSLLTPEQQAQFDKNIAELKQRGERRGKPGPHTRPQHGDRSGAVRR